MKQFLIQYNIVLGLCICCFLLTGFGGCLVIFGINSSLGYELLIRCSYIGQIFGAIYVLSYSDIHKSKYIRYIIVIFALLLIGIVARIIHWVGYDFTIRIILTIVPPFFVVIYFSRFIKKHKKNIGDILKFLWAFSLFPMSYLFLVKRMSLGTWFFIIAIFLNISMVIYTFLHSKKQVIG